MGNVVKRITYRKSFLSFTPFNLENKNKVIFAILKNLTPDLLAEKRFLDENKINSLYGHCYHASQVFYYITDPHKYQPFFAFNDYRGGTHWWLQNDEEILDITAEQYYNVGMTPPYENGSAKTWKISKRSYRLLKRVLETLNVGYFERIVL
jgi:hypothetical protein